jgi:hypothetical protein
MKPNGFYEPVGFSVTCFFQCLDSEYMGVSWGIPNSWMIFKLGVHDLGNFTFWVFTSSVMDLGTWEKHGRRQFLKPAHFSWGS